MKQHHNEQINQVVHAEFCSPQFQSICALELYSSLSVLVLKYQKLPHYGPA
jgi:hypothetical protein